jgi:surface protein
MDFMFSDCQSLTSVPKFNTSNVTSMYSTFLNCYALTSIPLLDTSKVTLMRNMCSSCRSLTTVPLFDTSSATDMQGMLYLSSNVRSGALALYRQASTQAVPPVNHNKTFSYCGSNTTSGRAELAQIPADWGGTAT